MTPTGRDESISSETTSSPSTTATDTTPTTIPSVIERVQFFGRDLVVRLVEDHDASQVSLIGPDGSEYVEAGVEPGGAARLQVLSIEPGSSEYRHYQPGTHELVVGEGESAATMPISLEPSIRVIGVQPLFGADDAVGHGRFGVLVENDGSGPTWVYDVAYQDAPNPDANRDLVDSPGKLRLTAPGRLERIAIPPGEKRYYVGSAAPLLFSNKGGAQCTGDTGQLTAQVGIASGTVISLDVQFSKIGDVTDVGDGRYACTNNPVHVTAKTSSSDAT